MQIDVQAEITIARPLSEVAALVFDPGAEQDWAPNTRRSRVITPPPLREGTRTDREVWFLGRSVSYQREVVDTDGRTYLEETTTNPFPVRVSQRLSEVPEGTRVSMRITGSGSWFFGVAAALLGPVIRRDTQFYLESLKTAAEQRAATQV